MKCKCGYSWIYKGKSLRVTCPGCDAKIRVDKKVDTLPKVDNSSDKVDIQTKLDSARRRGDLFMIEYYKSKL